MAHILAVDDDPDLCTLLKTALERDGHAVETRTSGAAVTEFAETWRARQPWVVYTADAADD